MQIFHWLNDVHLFLYYPILLNVGLCPDKGEFSNSSHNTYPGLCLFAMYTTMVYGRMYLSLLLLPLIVLRMCTLSVWRGVERRPYCTVKLKERK